MAQAQPEADECGADADDVQPPLGGGRRDHLGVKTDEEPDEAEGGRQEVGAVDEAQGRPPTPARVSRRPASPEADDGVGATPDGRVD